MDRLGRDSNKKDDQQGYGRDKTSPYALESTKREYSRHLRSLDGLEQKKVLIFEEAKKGSSLLDETQIREEE
jgi:hypothetical protein